MCCKDQKSPLWVKSGLFSCTVRFAKPKEPNGLTVFFCASPRTLPTRGRQIALRQRGVRRVKKRYWIATGLATGAVVIVGGLLTMWGDLEAVRLYFANNFTSIEWEEQAAVVEVPIDSTEMHIVLPVMLNGQGPFRFALDTGSPLLVILSSERTEELALETYGRFQVGGSGEGHVAYASRADDIDVGIGSLTLVEQSVVVLPWHQLPLSIGSEPMYDGIIGYDLFRRFAVEFDGSHELLRIYPPGTLIVDPEARELPLTFTGRKPYVATSVLLEDEIEIPANLQLDTGSRGFLSLLPGSHPAIRIPEKSVERYRWGVSGRKVLRQARVNAFVIGGFRLDGVTASFTVSGDETDGDRQGVLGFSLLRRFDFIIDYAGERLYLKSSNRVDQPFEFDMSGMDINPDGPFFIVREVYEKTPAAASGLKSEDRIVSVNGSPAGEFTLTGLESLLRRHGTLVRLCVERDEMAATPICVSLSLERRG